MMFQGIHDVRAKHAHARARAQARGRWKERSVQGWTRRGKNGGRATKRSLFHRWLSPSPISLSLPFRMSTIGLRLSRVDDPESMHAREKDTWEMIGKRGHRKTGSTPLQLSIVGLPRDRRVSPTFPQLRRAFKPGPDMRSSADETRKKNRRNDKTREF